MIYLFWFFVFYIGLILYARKYRNPYTLNMYFGKKGCGKSTYIAKLAIRYLRRGFHVYVTSPLPGCIFLPPELVGVTHVPPNSVLLIDEVGMIWDNRNFKNFSSDVRDFFKLQRHYKVTVHMFSQAWDIDKKLRDLCDNLYIVTNVMGVFSYRKHVIKKFVVTEPTGDTPGSIMESLRIDSPLFAFFGARGFTFIPRYVKFFDSFEAPQLPIRDLQVCPVKHKDFLQRIKLSYRIKLQIRKIFRWKGIYIKWIIQRKVLVFLGKFIRKKNI